MWIFALQSFNCRMPLLSSQHFPFCVASHMSVQVRPHDLASSRCVQLSVRMSAAVSMSLNQSSSFDESCPSNVGISWSIVVVRLDSLCVTWSCVLVPHWTGGWLECHGEMLKLICELQQFFCRCGLRYARF